MKRVSAIFFKTDGGREPAREWLKALNADDRKIIGEDIKTVEFGWPIGMPVCRAMGDGLHEVRCNLQNNRIARMFFYIDKLQRMVLLHATIKKSRKTADEDLDLARNNKRKHMKGMS